MTVEQRRHVEHLRSRLMDAQNLVQIRARQAADALVRESLGGGPFRARRLTADLRDAASLYQGACQAEAEAFARYRGGVEESAR